MKNVLRAALAAAVIVGFNLGTWAAPAQAHHNEVQTEIQVTECQVTGTTSWTIEDHRVDSTVLAVLAGGEVTTAPVGEVLEVELAAGTESVKWRVWGGGERDYDSPALSDLGALVSYLKTEGTTPLDVEAPGVAWHDLAVTGCLAVEPTTPAPTEPAPTEPAPTEEPCVDVNTASEEELVQLKHVNTDRAAQIIELRPFTSVDDLGRVEGLAAGGPRLAELVEGGDGFLPLCEISSTEPTTGPAKELPLTSGVSLLPLLLVGGGTLLGTGGLLTWIGRRRRTVID
jgi:hypothetical protein